MSKIRLGLVGYGANPKENIGRGRLLLKLAANSFEGVEAVGICDTKPESLAIAREEFPNAKCFDDFDAMLAEVPMDTLLIETPAYLHAVFAVKALAKNIHVLSDIPSVRTLDEAWDLWAAQEKSQAFYMTGANANLWGYIETAIDLKKRGLFGEPYYIEASYIHDCRGLWKDTPWRTNGLPIHYCTHSLGPVLRLIEEDIEWVSCFDTGSHINKTEGQHDAMAALFRTKSNVVIRLLTSFINNYLGGGHSYRFFTTKGCFERTPPYRTIRKEASESARTLFYSTDLYGYNNWTELPSDDSRPEYAHKKDAGHGGLDYAMLDIFFKAVREGGPSPISLREGLRMTLPGIYAAESARNGGQLTHIDYPWTASRPTFSVNAKHTQNV